jgi:2-iminoacetate synthase
MPFSEVFPGIPFNELLDQSATAQVDAVEAILQRGYAKTLSEFAILLSPTAKACLEPMAALSQKISLRQFGKTIRLFAPLYLSNECVNICRYCGFSRNNPIPRITIPTDQVLEETRKLARQGFRSLLLVAGEHPKYVSNGYVEDLVKRCLPIMPSISLELGPLETEPYRPLVAAGCENLVVYQETYHQPTYKDLHVAGPKKHFHWRMDTPERAYAAGFRRLGIGALLGLYDWRFEAIAVAAHARYLNQHCWKAQVAISMPRMRPAAGGFQPETKWLMGDAELVQYICALRLFLPHAGIVLSTREHPSLRNGLVPLGVTHMSAGASTEPGGYSHFDENNWSSDRDQTGEQFHIADERSPAVIATMIRQNGYEPVWKDFDQSLVQAESA